MIRINKLGIYGILALFAFVTVPLCAGQENALVNGSFEGADGCVPSGWNFYIGNNADVSMTVCKGRGMNGSDAIKIVNSTPTALNTYGTLSQYLKLVRGTKYMVSLWCRGTGVQGLRVVHGKSWHSRVDLGHGGDWNKVGFELVAEDAEFQSNGLYPIKILSEGVTKEAYVCNMQVAPRNQLVAIGSGSGAQQYCFYPAQKFSGRFETIKSFPNDIPKLSLPGDAMHLSPRNPVVDRAQADAAMGYDGKGLLLFFNVKKPKISTQHGESIWLGDSVQVVIDQKGAFNESIKDGNLEIGLAPARDGETPENWCYTLNRRLSSEEIQTRGAKTHDGYFIAARIPWTFLKDVNLKKGILSANIAVNDYRGGKRYTSFLASGIHDVKSCAENFPVLLCGSGENAFVAVREEPFLDRLEAKAIIVHAKTINELKVVCADKDGKAEEVPVSIDPGSKMGVCFVSDILVDITKLSPGPLTLNVVKNGNSVASASAHKKDFYADLKIACDAFVPKYNALKSDADALAKEGRSSSKLNALMMILERQKSLIEKDVSANLSGDESVCLGKRDLQSIDELNELINTGSKIVEELKKDGINHLLEPPQVSSQHLVLKDGWFMGRSMETSELVPAALSGFGHFKQVVRDIPYLSKLGCNVMQIEIGPSAVIVGENEDGSFRIDKHRFETEILSTLEQASKNNMSVTVLLSPHYFPQWAFERHPEIKARNGFLKYEFNHPYAKKVIEAYLKTVVPMLRDSQWSGALHSICLSNEPVYMPQLENEFPRSAFAAYLAEKYGNIENLNTLWGASYKNFEAAVGIENPVLGTSPDSLFLEFHLYAQKSMADWQRWMAETVRGEWPVVPLHSKIMIFETLKHDLYCKDNIDPEAFADIFDINGNDNYFYPTANNGDWIQSAMGHSLQRSFKKAEIMNSENHVIADRDLRPHSADFLYTALFQQFMCGLGSSTMWLWEDSPYRSYLNKDDPCPGDIYRRPVCLYGMVAATMDASRLAPEIKRFFDCDPEVGILYSQNAAILDREYLDDAKALFTNLSYTGRKIGFVSEKQLKEGRLGSYKLLFAPSCTHFDRDAYSALVKAVADGKFKVVTLGNTLKKDQFGQALDAGLLKAESASCFVQDSKSIEKLTALMDGVLGVLPVRVASASDDAIGMEWKVISEGEDSFLLNITNYNTGDKDVEFKMVDGGLFKAIDLISGKQVPANCKLRPLQPKLLRISK